MNEKALVILQARMSSKRFPGKVMKELNGAPMIMRQLDRIKRAQCVDKIVVATTKDQSDDVLADFLLGENIEFHRGDMEDVISRFAEIVSSNPLSTVVRLTADCPLVMSELLDEMINDFWSRNCEYLSNSINPTYPDGLDVEVFSREALLKLNSMDLSKSEREHVTLGFMRSELKFNIYSYESSVNNSNMRWTVDYPQDLEFIRNVYSHFQGREDRFSFQEVLNLLIKDSSIVSSISGTRRNESLKDRE